MKEYKYYFIYRTTNLINGKIYIGVHFTNNILDNYLGSGKVFKSALLKYGKENFNREILYRFQNRQQAFFCESIIVDKAFIERSDTYNTSLGGRAGTGMLGKTHSNKARKLISEKQRGIPKSKKSKRRMSISAKKRIGEKNNFYGKTHSKETKQYISEFVSKHNIGEGNPCYGKRGMHDPNTLENKFIPLDEIDHYKSIGWNMGLKPRKEYPKPKWTFKQDKLQCPYCNKVGGAGAMKRYHFDNCKFITYSN